MANLPLMPDAARRASIRLNNASGTTMQTLLTCAAKGGLIETLSAASTHVEAAGIWLYVMIGDASTEFHENAVLIPAASASVPLQRVNLLSVSDLPHLAYTNGQYRLGGNDLIKIYVTTAIPVGAVIDVTAKYGEYPV